MRKRKFLNSVIIKMRDDNVFGNIKNTFEIINENDLDVEEISRSIRKKFILCLRSEINEFVDNQFFDRKLRSDQFLKQDMDESNRVEIEKVYRFIRKKMK